jgi:DNA-directed RNA polymerase specialized sigma subunit
VVSGLGKGEAPQEWWVALRTGTPEQREAALDLLARHSQDLVRSIALALKSTLPSWVGDDDLISYGQIGLLRAMGKYNPQEGPFRRFAQLLHLRRDPRRATQPGLGPTRPQARPAGAARGHQADRQGAGRGPTSAQVAERMGWSEERLEAFQRQVTNSHHRTLEGSDFEDETLLEPEDSQASLSSDAMTAKFVETFDTFDLLTQYVLARLYFQHETLTAVAASTNLPLALVRQLHSDAVVRLYAQVKKSVE